MMIEKTLHHLKEGDKFRMKPIDEPLLVVERGIKFQGMGDCQSFIKARCLETNRFVYREFGNDDKTKVEIVK